MHCNSHVICVPLFASSTAVFVRFEFSLAPPLALIWLSSLMRSLRCGLRAPRLWPSPTCSTGNACSYLILFRDADDAECKTLASRSALNALTIQVPYHSLIPLFSAIPLLATSDLSVGENKCLDRCVSKVCSHYAN